MKIYLIAYSQNKYQKQEILDFVKYQNVIHSSHHDNDDLETILKKVDKIWIILPGVLNPGTFYCDVYKKELKAKELKIPVEYFKINQTERYAELVCKVKRDELVPANFEQTKKFFESD
jgi:hypothetical protein